LFGGVSVADENEVIFGISNCAGFVSGKWRVEEKYRELEKQVGKGLGINFQGEAVENLSTKPLPPHSNDHYFHGAALSNRFIPQSGIWAYSAPARHYENSESNFVLR